MIRKVAATKRMAQACREIVEKHLSAADHVGSYRARDGKLRRPGVLWISWEKHRRTRELAVDLDVPLVEMDLRLSRFLKHPYFLLRTFLTIVAKKPRTLIIQCPSVVLGVWASLLKKVFRYSLIVDSHN